MTERRPINARPVIRWSLACTAVAISGCATTPEEIKALGARDQVEVPMPYHDAALCAVTRMEQRLVYADATPGRNIPHQLKTNEAERYTDIIGDSGASGAMYVVTVREIDPARSLAQIYVSNNMMFAGGRIAGIRSAIATCRYTSPR